MGSRTPGFIKFRFLKTSSDSQQAIMQDASEVGTARSASAPESGLLQIDSLPPISLARSFIPGKLWYPARPASAKDQRACFRKVERPPSRKTTRTLTVTYGTRKNVARLSLPGFSPAARNAGGGFLALHVRETVRTPGDRELKIRLQCPPWRCSGRSVFHQVFPPVRAFRRGCGSPIFCRCVRG